MPIIKRVQPVTLAVGDYVKFKDIGFQTLYRGKELEGLITWVQTLPLNSGRTGIPLFNDGETVFILQPWKTFQNHDGGWWVAPEIRYNLDDIEVIHHIPRTVR